MELEKLKGIGNIFSSSIQTDAIPISNYQSIDFYVFCGDGIYAETTVTIQGSSGESDIWSDLTFYKDVNGEYQERISDVVAIGRNGESHFKIESKMLADKKIDKVRFCTSKITACIVAGIILARKSEPRYSN